MSKCLFWNHDKSVIPCGVPALPNGSLFEGHQAIRDACAPKNICRMVLANGLPCEEPTTRGRIHCPAHRAEENLYFHEGARR